MRLSLLGILPFLAMTPLSAQTEIVAHRGYSAKAPENTLAAFRLAWESGADACELDLRISADGELVVIHDKDTERVAGVKKEVAKTDFETLRALDVGSWKDPAFADERIPTLKEALQTLPETPEKRFFIEVKTGTEILPALTEELVNWEERGEQLVLISFSKEVTVEAKKQLPWLTVLQLSSARSRLKLPVSVGDLIAHAEQHQLDGLNLSREFDWNLDLVRRIHDAGLKAAVWTVNDPEQARRLNVFGVDAITTDDPVKIREALSTDGF